MRMHRTRALTVGTYDRAVGAAGPDRASADRLKRGCDIVLTIGILLAFLPLLLIIGAALLTQGRPFVIRHARVGLGGRIFPCLKFRTMVVDAEAVLHEHLARDPLARIEWEATRKLRNDPRVTALGWVLRRSSMDELPQLINVLRGDMSLVGPRPIVTAEIKHYGVGMAFYEQVRPGMTGAWQVSGRSDTSYAYRVCVDCEYVLTRSFRRDLGILVRTLPAVLGGRGSC